MKGTVSIKKGIENYFSIQLKESKKF